MTKLLTAVACAVAWFAAPALAGEPSKDPLKPYVPLGTRLSQKPEDTQGDIANRFFDDMARCTVQRAPDKVDYFLRQSDDFGMSSQVEDVTKFLPLPECLGDMASDLSVTTQGRFTPRALRNWLSERAYIAAHKRFSPLAPDAVVPPREYFSREGLLRAQGYGAFSDCMVAEDPQAADALVRTVRGSREERVAAGALVPAMSRCLTKEQTLELTQDTVRGLAAQGLWQRYEAPKPTRYKGAR